MTKEEKPDPALNPELEQMQALYAVMLEKGLDAVELKDEESRVRLTRRPAPTVAGEVSPHHGVSARSMETPLAQGAAPAPSVASILTPLAGVFYRASSPASVSFVKEGDTVEPGQIGRAHV